MKKKARFLTVLILAMSTLVFAIPVYAADDSEIPHEVIYRMYNPNSGEHLYTSSAGERAALYKAGWDAEDIGWVAPKSSSTPIYRLYNGVEHLYSKDPYEAKYLSEHGWSDEGIKFYSNDNQTVPMYRLYNPNNGQHHYTTDIKERYMLKGFGWELEGVAWYTLKYDTSTITLPTLPERFDNNIKTVDAFSAIEADVKLSGSGTGYHAKLLYQTPVSAVSFGIQYDDCAGYPYTEQTYYLCENVSSNDPGCQRYTFYDLTSKDVYHRIMLTYDLGGVVTFYVDGNKVDQVINPGLDEGDLYLSVEGSARLEGDYVDATFKNIKVKNNWTYNETELWPTYPILTNPGMHIEKTGFDESSPATGTVNIAGTIIGIGDMNWDSAYESVSGVMHLGNALRVSPHN